MGVRPRSCRASISMARLWKISAKDVPQVSWVESPDSSKDPFVPNDFADKNVMSLDFSADDAEFDKALYNFYVNSLVLLLVFVPDLCQFMSPSRHLVQPLVGVIARSSVVVVVVPHTLLL
ncbi:uncharacterized protein LOC119317568 [Triticum dicoccoides]|uniref:uncharacterized protein LOC119317568 n=1 Tax=Triticum dicoccoides TaxID=85692 RepID=UPI001891A3FE|nr:uncharacterized protein LOC119317568 [Triticum dicoccoides]